MYLINKIDILFLLPLILLIQVPIVISNQPTNHYIVSHTSLKENNRIQVLNSDIINLDNSLNIIGKQNSVSKVDRKNQINIDSNSYDSLNIKLLNASKDEFNYPEIVFNNIINNGTGSIHYKLDYLTDSVNFFKYNTSYSNSFTSYYNMKIDGFEVLELSISNEEWFSSDLDFGFNTIDFSFNSLTIHLILDYTPSFISTISNSTNNIYLINLNNEIKFEINKLANEYNSINPNELVYISWNTFLSNDYNYNVTINKLSMVKSLNSAIYIINDVEYESSEVTQLEIINDILIKFEDSIIAYLNITLSYSRDLLFYIDLIENNPKEILVETIFDTHGLRPEHDYSIKFPDSVKEISYYEENKEEIFEYDENTTFAQGLRYTLNFSIYKQILGINLQDEILQGKEFRLNLSDLFQYKILHAFIFNENSLFLIGTLYNEIVDFNIPFNWSKGRVNIFLFSNKFDLFVLEHEMYLSPMDIINESSYEFYPSKRKIIPINLINITSQLVFLPDNIFSYYPDMSFRSVDNSEGLVLWPDEFKTGNITLFLKIIKLGFVPLSLEFSIFIKEISLDYHISVFRESQTNARVKVIIDNIFDIDFNISMIILKDEITYFNETIDLVTSYYNIFNPDWNSLKKEIVIIIHFGNNSGIFKHKIIINEFETPSTSIENNKNSFLLALKYIIATLVILSIILLLLKKIRERTSERNINF